MKLKDLILNYLPMCLRKVGIYALIKVLLSPLVRIYETYLSWIEEKRKQVSYTGQQCMLRQIVRDELGIDIVISSLDGKPYDFMVTIQGKVTDTMRNRLTALVDKYKPGYKSWRYSDAGQDDIITYSAEWIEYVEQVQNMNGISLKLTGRHANVMEVDYTYTIQTDYPVTHDLSLKLSFVGSNDEYDYTQTLKREVSILSGTNSVEVNAMFVRKDTNSPSVRYIKQIDVDIIASSGDKTYYFIKEIELS